MTDYCYYIGVYPKGMSAAVQFEMHLLQRRFHAVFLAQDAVEEKHCLMHFGMSTHHLSEKPFCFTSMYRVLQPAMDTQGGERTYRTMTKHFVPETSITMHGNPKKKMFKKRHRVSDPEALCEAEKVIRKHILQCRDQWQSAINKPWRATCQKQGEHAFSSVEICHLIGKILGEAVFTDTDGKHREMPKVSLTDYEMEVMCLVSHVEGDDDDVWVFGVRDHDDDQTNEICRWTVSRKLKSVGSENNTVQHPLSSTRCAVAACICLYVLSRYASCDTSDAGCGSSPQNRALRDGEMCSVAEAVTHDFLSHSHGIFLDPMCGMGTIPLILHAIVNRYELQSSTIASHVSSSETPVSVYSIGTESAFLGCDLEEGSVKLGQLIVSNRMAAAKSSHSNIRLFTSDTTHMSSIPTGAVDMIIVDPPWGHRHCTASLVMRDFKKWMKEWLRTLKEGGLLTLITIRTNHTMHDYKIHFERKGLCECIEQIQFNNAGFDQCGLFVFRKTANCQQQCRVDQQVEEAETSSPICTCRKRKGSLGADDPAARHRASCTISIQNRKLEMPSVSQSSVPK